ncbi:sugar ABC transporter substrate-binding protein [Erysipelothrix sp. HDW6C]|uniref:multiple monosaccharide ABC transporter substrate-binding protein n=1 Tax=Erysipelothrix sp. HDW6C TaxID=2714930 RepID=UPI0014094895|nr:multiple monosaccharide ABC transporter substrate-binding protein [Erysipelothrix sp. HDW6C]QIK70295.1 sugar ABC transporter substrate-binding protein [Erysipelothrix sp. HDW6C]
MKKQLLAVLLIIGLLLTGCGSKGGDGDKTIGIAMPTKDLERWEKDGNSMKEQAESLGYKVDMQFAQNEVQTQVSQIENMITKGVDVIIIAAIDGEALTDVTQKAKGQGIPVISYDRLIMNSDAIDYYATFDLKTVGVLQGEYIVKALDLENAAGPFNLELFGGAPDDNNARFFFEGAMEQLQPYIDSGKLIIKSGQKEFNQVATQSWSGSKAQERMDNLLSANYTQDRIDAVLTQNDALAIGVVSSLKGIGYGSSDRPMPIITGQDAETASVKSIIANEQTMTVFKDTSELAKVAIKMADSILKGETVDVNDTTSYNNGVKVVPTYYLNPVQVDVNNYEEILIGSGYFTEADLKN